MSFCNVNINQTDFKQTDFLWQSFMKMKHGFTKVTIVQLYQLFNYSSLRVNKIYPNKLQLKCVEF